MTRLNHKFFDKDAVIAKSVAGFIHRCAHPVSHISRTFDNPHSFSAAAGRRLYHHGVSDFLGLCHRLIYITDRPVCTGNAGYASRFCQSFRFNFVAHHFYCMHIRADKGQTGGLNRLNKTGIFRQKTIARMYRFSPCILGGLNDAVC